MKIDIDLTDTLEEAVYQEGAIEVLQCLYNALWNQRHRFLAEERATEKFFKHIDKMQDLI